MPGLEMVRSRDKDAYIPDTSILAEAMRVANKADSAKYLYERAKTIFSHLKKEVAVQNVLNILENHAKNMEWIAAKSTEALWAGQQLPSDFEAIQSQAAAEALEALKAAQPLDNVTLDVAISEGAELLRGYSKRGKTMDTDSVGALDKVFNAWLATQNKISEDSVIYECTPKSNGQKKLDSSGQPIRVDATSFKELLAHPKDGFAAYAQKHHKSAQMTVREQPYPEPAQPAPAAETTPGSST